MGDFSPLHPGRLKSFSKFRNRFGSELVIDQIAAVSNGDVEDLRRRGSFHFALLIKIWSDASLAGF